MHQASKYSGGWPVLSCRAYLLMNAAGPVTASMRLHLCKNCQNIAHIAPGRQLQRCVAGAGLQSIPANERCRSCHVLVTATMRLQLCEKCQNIGHIAPGRQLQRCVAGAGLQSIPAIGTLPGLSCNCTGLHAPASVRTLLNDNHALSCTNHQLCEGSYGMYQLDGGIAWETLKRPMIACYNAPT
jgi:hypothetical protein